MCFNTGYRWCPPAFIVWGMLSLHGCFGEGAVEPPAEMGKVTGKVTIGGRVVPGVDVIFEPVEGGGPSRGATDKEGHYELEYGGGGLKGAILGTHRVAFEHYAEDMVNGEPVPGGESSLPDKYFPGKSKITRDVKSGEQVIDFELDAK